MQLQGNTLTHVHLVIHQTNSDIFGHKSMENRNSQLQDNLYLHTTIEPDLYMKFPKVFEKNKFNGKTHILKLISNLYGHKQAVRVWNRYLTEKRIC